MQLKATESKLNEKLTQFEQLMGNFKLLQREHITMRIEAETVEKEKKHNRQIITQYRDEINKFNLRVEEQTKAASNLKNTVGRLNTSIREKDLNINLLLQ